MMQMNGQEKIIIENSLQNSGHSHSASHPHQHDDSILRLKSAEGHLRGVQRMLEQDQYCIDVIQQIRAVQAALNKVTANILEQHLNSCVITAVKGENANERERVLNELMDVFDASTKI
jgi:DNA-binding FrmR family transcriptional regulator